MGIENFNTAKRNYGIRILNGVRILNAASSANYANHRLRCKILFINSDFGVNCSLNPRPTASDFTWKLLSTSAFNDFLYMIRPICNASI